MQTIHQYRRTNNAIPANKYSSTGAQVFEYQHASIQVPVRKY